MTEGRIYRVVNKVFDTHFWTKEDADKFLNSNPPTSGFRIEEVTIFGKRPDWCPLKATTLTEEYNKRLSTNAQEEDKAGDTEDPAREGS